MPRPNGGAGEGAGSERDSSRAGDCRRPSARRREGTVLKRYEAFGCPDCGWAHVYDEPMEHVFCVRCFREGRGTNVECARLADPAGAAERAEKAEAMVALWERRFDIWQNWRVFEQEHPDSPGGQ
jgi:hypothetical protein